MPKAKKSPFYKAVTTDNLDAVIKAFNNDPMIILEQTRNKDSVTLAAEHGSLKVLQWLIESRSLGYKSVSKDSHLTPIMFAACLGHANIVKYLLDKEPALLFSTNKFGHTIISMAAYFKHRDLLKWLLEIMPCDTNSWHKASCVAILAHAFENSNSNKELLYFKMQQLLSPSNSKKTDVVAQYYLEDMPIEYDSQKKALVSNYYEIFTQLHSCLHLPDLTKLTIAYAYPDEERLRTYLNAAERDNIHRYLIILMDATRLVTNLPQNPLAAGSVPAEIDFERIAFAQEKAKLVQEKATLEQEKTELKKQLDLYTLPSGSISSSNEGLRRFGSFSPVPASKESPQSAHQLSPTGS